MVCLVGSKCLSKNKNLYRKTMSALWKENIVFTILLNLILTSKSQIIQQKDDSCPTKSCKICKYKVTIGFLKAKYEERISKESCPFKKYHEECLVLFENNISFDARGLCKEVIVNIVYVQHRKFLLTAYLIHIMNSK